MIQVNERNCTQNGMADLTPVPQILIKEWHLSFIINYVFYYEPNRIQLLYRRQEQRTALKHRRREQVVAPINIFTTDRNSEEELHEAFSQNKNSSHA